MIDIIAMEHKFSPEDKTRWWGDGEWVNEMDYLKFKYKEYVCEIIRVADQEPFTKEEHIFGGHLCGYVSVPLEMELAPKEFDLDYDVHGGITYNVIRKDGSNWIGFDCAHSMDYVPSMEKLTKQFRESGRLITPEYAPQYPLFQPTYKNIDFVTDQCKFLVDQLAVSK